MIRQRRDFKISFLALGTLALLPWVTFFGRLNGRAVLGGDTEPALDPALVSKMSGSIWTNHALFGSDTTLLFGSQFPHLALLRAASGLHIDGATSSKAELAILWTIGIVMAYEFVRLFGVRRSFAVAATIPYAAGPIAYILFQTPTVAGVGGYAVTPLTLFAIGAILKRRSFAWIAVVIAAFALPYCSQNPAYAGIPLVGSALLIAVIAWARAFPLARFASAWLAISWIVALNMWWIVPEAVGFYHVGKELAASRVNAAYDETSIARTAIDNSPLYLARFAISNLFLTDVKDGPFGMTITRAQLLAPYFVSPLVQIGLAVPSILVIAAIVARRFGRYRRRLIVAAATGLGIAYLLAAGRGFPGAPLSWALNLLPVGALYREPFSKFGILLALFECVLVAFALQHFRARGVRLAYAFFCAVVLAPLVFGHGTAADVDHKLFLGVAIPGDLALLKGDLDRTAGFERDLQAPLSANYSLEHFAWGYIGPGFYRNYLRPTILEAVASPSADDATNDVLRRLNAALESGDYRTFATLTAWAGVSGVFWNGDAIPTFGGPVTADLEPIVRNIPGAHVAAHRGKFELERLAGRPDLVVVRPVVDYASTEIGMHAEDLIVRDLAELRSLDTEVRGRIVSSQPWSTAGGIASIADVSSGRTTFLLGPKWPFHRTIHGASYHFVPLVGSVDSERRRPRAISPLSFDGLVSDRRLHDLQPIRDDVVVVDLDALGRFADPVTLDPSRSLRLRRPFESRKNFATGDWTFANGRTSVRLVPESVVPTIGDRSQSAFIGDGQSATISLSERAAATLRFYSGSPDPLVATQKQHLLPSLAYEFPSYVTGAAVTIDVYDDRHRLFCHRTLAAGWNRTTFTVPESLDYTFAFSVTSADIPKAPTSLDVGTLYATAGDVSDVSSEAENRYIELVDSNAIVRRQENTRQTIVFPVAVQPGEPILIHAIGTALADDGVELRDAYGHVVSRTARLGESGVIKLEGKHPDIASVTLIAGPDSNVSSVIVTRQAGRPSSAQTSCKPRVQTRRFDDTAWEFAVQSPCPFALAVKVQYASGWSMTGTERRGVSLNLDDRHFRAYGYANAWSIPAGSWTLIAHYRPMALVRAGVIAEALACILLFALMLIERRRIAAVRKRSQRS